MRILAIRIKNLASLEGVTSIDFTQEPLSSAGIFAITGPTGAGKSTILDALCLALYAKTPRYTEAKETGVDIRDVQGSTITQSDIRGILRRGTADGFAEVDFIGTDGNQYRAQWSIRRARNKAEGALQAYQVTLKNIASNTDLPGTKTELLAEIERLVGLNFDQFTRSVLLAQGDFTAFLKAGKDEKSALLEKLTGTHIYSEISRRVFEKHRNEAQELRDLNTQREGISTLTNEETVALNEQKIELGTALQAQEKQVNDLTKEITWHDQLLVLQTSLTSANDAYKIADQTKKEAAEREQKLRQAELVQSARTFVDARNNTTQQLIAKNAAFAQLVKDLDSLQMQKATLRELLQTAETDVTNKTQATDDAKPLLEEARKLDVQIAERNEQVNQAKKEADAANEKHLQQQKLVEEKEEENKLLQNSISQLQKWKTENIARKPIADNHNLILSKLADAQKQLDVMHNASSQLKTAGETIEIKKKEKDKLQKDASKQLTTVATEKQAYETIFSEVSAVDIDELEQNKSLSDATVEELITAEAHWKLLWNSIKDHDAFSLTLAGNRKELAAQKKQLTKANQQLESAKAQREASLHMVEKARLAAAENVEVLRTQLVSGDHCPVCGSTEHPYAGHNPQLDHVLAELENAYKEHEIAYTDCLSAQSALNTSSGQLQKIIGKQETELVSKENTLKELQETWGKFSIYKQCKKLSDEEKAAWLKLQLKEKKTVQKQLQTKIQAYHAQKLQLEEQKKQFDQSEKQLAATNEAIKEIDRNLKSLKEEQVRNTKELELAKQELDQIKETLLPSFSTGDWFEQWKKKPKVFVQGIQIFAAEWKKNALELEEKSAQQGILTATINGLQEQVKQALEESGKKKENLATIEKSHSELIKKRKTFFNGEAVSAVEMRLKEALATAQQAFEQRKTEQEKWQTEFTRANTQKEQTEKDITALQQQKTGWTGKITEWLLTHNKQQTLALDEETLEKLLLLTAEWMDAERLALQTISDALTQAKSIRQERQNLLQQHEQQKHSDKQKDELTVLLEEAKVLFEQTTKDKTEIGFRLQQDEVNKQKIGDLLKILEAKSKVVENWAKLNDIIGSADGKKFRQIAQEYTLDVLLDFANLHLEMLSKRYLLQRIPATLGLQVLDKDMGNEVRTVYSLSGGESFLVSLALALGLASLSSSRMQVESLFIDEGFGSLDPNTLNIAMDALERLHNQGRKVGVISHVQEMTERIPVQIKVSKQSSGKSLVEVI